MVHRLLRAAIATALVLACAPGLRAQAQKPSLPGYPAPGAEPIVTLLAAGSEPRSQLRFRLRPAQQETMDLMMQMGMTMSIAELSMPVEVPPLTITARAEVLDLASNGDITYVTTFTKLAVGAGGNEAAAAALKEAIAGMTAVKSTGVISNRGVPRSMKMDTSGVTDPTMKQMLDQMAASFQNLSMPMPEEAVGVGGSWEVRSAIESGAASVFQKAVYEIVSMDGPAVTLKVKIEQTAPPQSVRDPNLPPGVDATLSKMTGRGAGTVTLRLDSLTPASSLESTTTMSMDVAMNGQTQSMTVQMTLKMTVTPVK